MKQEKKKRRPGTEGREEAKKRGGPPQVQTRSKEGWVGAAALARETVDVCI